METSLIKTEKIYFTEKKFNELKIHTTNSYLIIDKCSSKTLDIIDNKSYNLMA
jgi:hypothetical protein